MPRRVQPRVRHPFLLGFGPCGDTGPTVAGPVPPPLSGPCAAGTVDLQRAFESLTYQESVIDAALGNAFPNRSPTSALPTRLAPLWVAYGPDGFTAAHVPLAGSDWTWHDLFDPLRRAALHRCCPHDGRRGATSAMRSKGGHGRRPLDALGALLGFLRLLTGVPAAGLSAHLAEPAYSGPLLPAYRSSTAHGPLPRPRSRRLPLRRCPSPAAGPPPRRRLARAGRQDRAAALWDSRALPSTHRS